LDDWLVADDESGTAALVDPDLVITETVVSVHHASCVGVLPVHPDGVGLAPGGAEAQAGGLVAVGGHGVLGA